jgi:SSS family solute:Na+ symporter
LDAAGITLLEVITMMPLIAEGSMPAGYTLGTGGLAFIGLYVLSLIGVGWLGHRAKRAETLDDHYLGGRALGMGVLFLTLYATQYSGNSFMGFVGKAYRGGFPFLYSVIAMMAVVAGYFVFAPRLHRLSHRKGYVTLGDYVQDRFGYRPLTVFIVMLGILGLANYVLTNLLALGKLTEVVSGGQVGFNVAVVLLAAVMVSYETLGGMRSVAWTDVIQGIILLVSLCFIAFALFVHLGGPAGVAEGLEAANPKVWDPPTGMQKVGWLSSALLFFFGISMYPHAIQRIYAARNESALRRSLQMMAFMPLVTTLVLVLLGIMAIAILPGLDAVEIDGEIVDQSDRTILFMVGKLVDELPAIAVMGPLLVAAVIAATMSTIDSALLSISSMVSNDLYRPVRPKVSTAHLTRVGKQTSVLLMIAVVLLTIALQDQTIWRLLEIKLEILAQIAPTVMLGLQWRKLKARAVFAGAVTGTSVAICLTLGAAAKPLGVHAGIWGLGANLLMILIVQTLSQQKQKLPAT